MSTRSTAVAGYAAQWRRLPRTIRIVVVLRDTPFDPPGTTGCIVRAMRARRPAGTACAIPRRRAIRADAEAAAGRAWHGRSKRVAVVELTRFMCDPGRCFPVVGGALVHKDGNHLTATFGATLAPYLRRALVRLGVG